MSIPFLACGEPWGCRVHSGGVRIPCAECHKLFPQIHQMRQNVLYKKQKKKNHTPQAFICFLSNLLPHTVSYFFNMLAYCRHSDFILFWES